jgi:hypothetical protein
MSTIIVFAYRVNWQHAAKLLISKLKDIFEIRNLDILKFFLSVQIIQDRETEIIYLVQNVYAEKLIKKYAVSINQKTSISLFYQSLTSYMKEVDSDRIHVYKQKVKFICYLAIITRSDIVKTISKFIEFSINFDFYHLMIVNHCIRDLHVTQHLTIKFDVSRNEKLIIQIDMNSNTINQIDFISNKQMFETSVDASFANKEERRLDKSYTFKLFDNLIDWTARKQVIISTSIIEMKLLAMLHAEKEFIW